MKLWAFLYVMVWLSFAEIVFVVVADLEKYIPYLVPIHIIVGIALILLAAFNSVEIEKTKAPKRIARIAKASMMMAIGAAVTGVMRAFIDCWTGRWRERSPCLGRFGTRASCPGLQPGRGGMALLG